VSRVQKNHRSAAKCNNCVDWDRDEEARRDTAESKPCIESVANYRTVENLSVIGNTPRSDKKDVSGTWTDEGLESSNLRDEWKISHAF
jgi:hypothetical protein